MSPDLDVVVIGAGVVGLAVAERLSRTGRGVTVVEELSAAGTVTTSRNSQVIHAGMYYPTGTWKARLCVQGNRSLRAWCAAHQVPFSMVGKLIVATTPAEEPELSRILEQGRANGVAQLELVDRAFVHRLEPTINAVAALWSPDTGVLDVHAFVQSLLEAARSQGAEVIFRHRLVSVSTAAGRHELSLRGPDGEVFSVSARTVINAAGLQADRVAAMAGIDVDQAGYRQHFVKGHYFRVTGRHGISHLVYPVPEKSLAGLGVHATIGLDGDLRLGPDVLPLPDRAESYEVPDSLAGPFQRAASRFLPWLTEERLAPDQAGIRPKLALPSQGFRDFVIAEESARGLPGWVNLLGIESPGITAALEIGEVVEQRVREPLHPPRGS